MYLNYMINLIFQTYLNNSFCTLHYYDPTEDSVNLETIPTISINGEENLHLDKHELCDHFLVQHKNAKIAFEKIEYVIKMESKRNYSFRKYIIIVNTVKELNNFYKSTILTFVRDVLVVLLHSDKQFKNKFGLVTNNAPIFDLYTHRYVGLSRCNDPLLLDTWFAMNRTFKFGNYLYPNKITNQLGRELRAPCYDHIPFAACKLGTLSLCI